MRIVVAAAVLTVLALSSAAWAAEGAAAPAASAPAAGLPRVFVLDAAMLAARRDRARGGDKALAEAVKDLAASADKALKAGPFSVMDKATVPDSGDKHDYMSMGPYWWPDPAKPDGKPYIRRDGEVNPESTKFDRGAMNLMGEAVEVLAQAYYFTGDERYAGRAAVLLRAWFLDPATRMNPHLNYGQAVPGRTIGRGTGLIETMALIGVVDAVGLLAGSKAWPEADQKALVTWFDTFLTWMLESKIGRDEAAASNNHGTWYVAQVASFGLFVGKPDVAKKILSDARSRIDRQIEPDGRQPLELERTKSWGYSSMNLRGWFTAALLGDRVGVDLWTHLSKKGGSLRKALDFLLPFATGDAKWTHKQIAEFKGDLLAWTLRQAAVKFGEKKYAEAAVRADPKHAQWGRVLMEP